MIKSLWHTAGSTAAPNDHSHASSVHPPKDSVGIGLYCLLIYIGPNNLEVAGKENVHGVEFGGKRIDLLKLCRPGIFLHGPR